MNFPIQKLNDKPVVEICNLKMSLCSHEGSKSVTFKLFKGENLVLNGKSGSDKSVLIEFSLSSLIAEGGMIQVLE